jgi:hypothetical protein
MNKYLLASLLVVWLAGPAFAAYQMPPQSRIFVGTNGGHPDPCWSLRIQMMVDRDPYWRDLFEGCLVRNDRGN